MSKEQNHSDLLELLDPELSDDEVRAKLRAWIEADLTQELRARLAAYDAETDAAIFHGISDAKDQPRGIISPDGIMVKQSGEDPNVS